MSEVVGMADVAEIVRCHHESPDGKGCPRGLRGSAIPIEAAIVKVAETFVAKTHPRVYRGEALPRDQALQEIAGTTGQAFDPIAAYYLFDTMGRGDLASREIRFRSGRQFDPDVVQALLDVVEGAVFGESPRPERVSLADEPEEIALSAR